MADNRNKTKEVDESVLDETPPNINEPQPKEGEESQDIEETKEVEEDTKQGTEDETSSDTSVDTQEEKEVETSQKPPIETPDQKEQRYKAQQTEAQIQAAKNRAFIERVDQAKNLPEPTPDELKAFVAQDGVDWEELTTFEQATAKRSYKAEKSLSLIQEATEVTKKIDEWAKQVDTFIDSTDAKPAYIKLSSHEADFRKYCMQEAHRGTPIEILLSAFLFNLPEQPKVRGELMPRGGGGEKPASVTKITDADEAARLRESNPREYRRQLKQGKIALEV